MDNENVVAATFTYLATVSVFLKLHEMANVKVLKQNAARLSRSHWIMLTLQEVSALGRFLTMLETEVSSLVPKCKFNKLS